MDQDKKNILILGGNSLNILPIQEAKNNGFYVIVADKNPNAAAFSIADEALCADIIDPEALYLAVKDKNIHGVVSMAEAGVLSCSMLSEKLGLNGLSLEAALNATSKAAMRQLWSSIPEYNVKFKVVTTIKEAESAVESLSGKFPLMCKPDKTFGGSRGVSKIENAAQVKQSFEFASAAGMNEKILIEEFVDGREFSCEVLVYKGETSVLCIGGKVKSQAPYRVDLSVQYEPELTPSQRQSVDDMCQKAIAALGIYSGIAHIEFALTDKGPKLFELGARCGGGHTPVIAKHVSGVNEFVEYCRISCGKPPLHFKPLYKKGADYRFIIFPGGEILKIEEKNDLASDPGILDFVLTVKKGDVINELRTTSDRSGAIVTIADNLEDAVAISARACSNIAITYTDGTSSQAIFG